MSVIYQAGYALPMGDKPLTHARIVHSENWADGGTAVASSTATGYFANGPLGSTTYERWKPSAIAATWEYDHGSSFTADCIGIAAHTFGTAGCTFKLQYYDGAVWVDLTAAQTVADDSPILAIFAPVSAQRWRVNITSGTAPYMAVFRVGLALQMDRPLYGGHLPLIYGRQTVMRSNRSETGEFLGRTRQRVSLATSFAWSNLSGTWVRSNWASLQRAVETEPFFIAWRPGAFGDVGYCEADACPAPENQGVRDLMSVELKVRGLAND